MNTKWYKFKIIILLFLLVSFPEFAGATPLIISEQWLNDVRQEQGSYLINPTLVHLLKAAENDLTLKCNTPMDYNNQLTRITLAGHIKSNYSYLKIAKYRLFDLCNFDKWYRGDYGKICDLWCASVASEAALTYNWISDTLTDSEREFVLKSIKEKAVDLYLNDVAKNSWHVKNHHNWGGVVNGNMLIVSLALDKDLPECKTVKTHAQSLLKNYWSHFTNSGGWDEGISYLWYGLEAPAFAAYLGATTPNPNCANTAHWVRIFTSPADTVANFSDCTEKVLANSAAGFLTYQYNDPEALSLWESAINSNRYPTVYDLIYASSIPGRMKSTALPIPKRFIDKEIDWGVIRSIDNSAWCAIKGGSLLANHSHIDLGSFILVRNNQVLVSDPGCPRPYPTDYFNPLTRYNSPYVRLQSHSSINIEQEPQTIINRMNLEQGGSNSITCKSVLKTGIWTRNFKFINNQLVITDQFDPKDKWNITVTFPYNTDIESHNPNFNQIFKPYKISGSEKDLHRTIVECIPNKIKLVQFKSIINERTAIEWRF